MALGVTGKLILGFFTLILGVSLIVPMTSNSNIVTTKLTVANEANAFTPVSVNEINETEVHTMTNNPTSWKVNDCPLTSVSIKNASGGTALTETTDYVLDASTGTFTLVNNTNTVAMIGADNNTYVDYSYCGDDYLNLSWGRSMLNLIGGFFALAILGVSLRLFYSVGKETGII